MLDACEIFHDHAITEILKNKLLGTSDYWTETVVISCKQNLTGTN